MRADAYGSRRPDPRKFTMLVQCVTNRTDGYEWHGPWFPIDVERVSRRPPRPAPRLAGPRPPEATR